MRARSMALLMLSLISSSSSEQIIPKFQIGRWNELTIVKSYIQTIGLSERKHEWRVMDSLFVTGGLVNYTCAYGRCYDASHHWNFFPQIIKLGFINKCINGLPNVFIRENIKTNSIGVISTYGLCSAKIVFDCEYMHNNERVYGRVESSISQYKLQLDAHTVLGVNKTDQGNVGCYPWSTRNLHLIQLAALNIQLPPEDARRYYSNSHERESEQTDSARPSRHHPFIDGVLGCIFFGATAAAILAAFKSAEYADNYGSRFWWLPFVSFLTLAFWLANHAIGVFVAISHTGL